MFHPRERAGISSKDRARRSGGNPSEPVIAWKRMSALPQPSYVTPAEYLAAEREAERKSDYLNGLIVMAMAGVKRRHNLVAVNTLRRIANAFEGRPCVVYGSDMKVRVEKANIFRYPDVSALCGPIDFYDQAEDVYCNPRFICEVFSASTRSIDRHEKFAEYRLIDAFCEYLLINPDRMEAELHRKGADGRWTCAAFARPDEVIQLESIDVQLRVADLYEKVEFPPESSLE
jgi:Uma2 family endonuclease